MTSRATQFYDDANQSAGDIAGRKYGSNYDSKATHATAADNMSYGGSREAAEEEAKRLGQQGSYWDQKYSGVAQGPAIDYTAANAARAQGQQARGEQEYGQAAALAMAQGGGPSAATAQYAMNADAAMQAQASQGGLGAQRAGVQHAGGNLGALGGARAAETGAGQQAFAGGAGAMRQGDVSQGRADFGAQQAQSDMFYKQRGLGDEMSQYYNEQEYGARAAQLNGVDKAREIARQRALQRNQFEMDDAAAQDAKVAEGVNTMASIYTTMAKTSDERLKRGIRGL